MRSTGALMAGSCLYIATIGTDKDSRVRLIKSMSREFELYGRDQTSLAMFTRFILDWVQSKGIERLRLISSPASGGHMAGAAAYKVEAALQLLPIEVELIPSVSITAFDKSADGTIPGPDRCRLGSSSAKLQHRAILAAAFRTAMPAEIKPIDQHTLQSDRPELPKAAETSICKQAGEGGTSVSETGKPKLELAILADEPARPARLLKHAGGSTTPLDRAAELIALL